MKYSYITAQIKYTQYGTQMSTFYGSGENFFLGGEVVFLSRQREFYVNYDYEGSVAQHFHSLSSREIHLLNCLSLVLHKV